MPFRSSDIDTTYGITLRCVFQAFKNKKNASFFSYKLDIICLVKIQQIPIKISDTELSPLSSPAIVSRVVLQIPLVGLGTAPALGPQRFLQSPVLLHLGLKIVLSHLGQNVGKE